MRNLSFAIIALAVLAGSAVAAPVAPTANDGWLSCGNRAAQYLGSDGVTVWVVRRGIIHRPYAQGIELPGMVFDVENNGDHAIFNGPTVSNIFFNNNEEELGAPVTWSAGVDKVPATFSLKTDNDEQTIATFDFVACGTPK